MEVREVKSGGMHSGRYQEMKEQGRIHKEVKDMVIKSVTNFPFCCVTNNPPTPGLRPSTVIMATLSTGQVDSSPGLG